MKAHPHPSLRSLRWPGLCGLALLGVLLQACTRHGLQTRSAHVSPEPSLAAVAERWFRIGVGVHDALPQRPEDHALLLRHFRVVTPENSLKPAAVQPWAKDDRPPSWFYPPGDTPADRQLLLQRMSNHIHTVVRRYRGRITEWDVVNEALDDGNHWLRPSGWSRFCDDEFIAWAFRWTHQADPQALLIYNDYHNELPAKREKCLRLLRRLREQNVPIHAVGLQGHYEIDQVPFEELERTFDALRALGLKAVISELDIDMIPRARWWADGGRYREELARLDPYRDGLPPELLDRQAQQYARLFRLFRRHADVVERVSFWNLHDGQSWLNYFPWQRVNHPLLFDRNGRPKPAFYAVVEALRES
ncbi:MAG: endo-1,4-beta-xylanase [Limisphaera sp.]|nr:endo-1,4-beta-xylanase [Limisphaera sp.]